MAQHGIESQTAEIVMEIEDVVDDDGGKILSGIGQHTYGVAVHVVG